MKNALFAIAVLAVLCVAATGFGKGGHGGGHGGGHHGGGHHGGHHAGHHAHHGQHHAGHHTHHHTGHHAGYHNGAWTGHHDGFHSWHRGNWGGWGAYPSLWGAGAGLGWAANNYSYRNPFWSNDYAGNVNYAQPITTASYTPIAPNAMQVAGASATLPNQISANVGAAQPGNTKAGAMQIAANETEAEHELHPSENEQKALAQLDQGRDAFRAGNYAEAQKLAEQAIATFPENVVAHEFRNLTLFAQKKYRESAAGTYAVLAGGPGWNDETLMSFYPDRKTYDAQLADLKHYVKQDPKVADGQFLLAYHQLVGGHRDAARAELEQVAKLEPKDQLTSELLKSLSVEPKAEENKAS